MTSLKRESSLTRGKKETAKGQDTDSNCTQVSNQYAATWIQDRNNTFSTGWSNYSQTSNKA